MRRSLSTSSRSSIPALVSGGLVGGLAGFGIGGVATALPLLLSAVTFTVPALGVLLVLLVKPAVDALWAVKFDLGPAGALNLQSIFGIVFPLALCRLAWRELRSGGIPIPLMLTMVAFMAVTMSSAILSPDHYNGTMDASRILGAMLLIFAGREIGANEQTIRLGAMVLALYALAPVVLLATEGFGLITNAQPYDLTLSGVYRMRGLYHHPLDIGARCTIAIPFALYLRKTSFRMAERTGWTAWAVIVTAAACIPLVRSAIVVAVLEIVLWVWLCERRAFLGVIAAAAALCVALLAPVQQVLSGAARPLQEGTTLDFGSGRVLLYAAQLKGFADANWVTKLLGHGLHSTAEVIVENAPVPVPGLEEALDAGGGIGAHNQYFRLLTESGVAGVLALIAVFAVAGRLLLSARGRSLRLDDRLLSTATLIAFLGILVYSVVIVPLDTPSTSWPFWFVLGLATRLWDKGRVLSPA
jgi:hypothetical protein